MRSIYCALVTATELDVSGSGSNFSRTASVWCSLSNSRGEIAGFSGCSSLIGCAGAGVSGWSWALASLAAVSAAFSEERFLDNCVNC